MFKKLLIASFLMVQFGLHAFALSAFYLGAGGTYLNNKANTLVPKYQGIAPSLYAGVGGWMNEYLFLALEGFGGFEPYNIGSANDDVTLKTRYHYGLSFIPAVNLDNTVIGYLRLGYVRASFKDLDVTKGAAQYGIGLEVPICGGWSLRGEYDFIQFSGNNDGVGTITSNQGMISVIYRFEPILGGLTMF